MIKILSVFGTRPEAIKLSPLIHGMAARQIDFTSRVCVTAQHRQMLDQALDLFQIVPDYDLDVMEDNQTPTQVLAAVLSRLELILQQERPDWVLVQGDTTSTAAAALAAFHSGAKVAHVEAGLRTGDKLQPFPEEINRRITSLIADLHFAPTPQTRRNLIREGVPENRILVTGNTIIDALRWALQHEPPTEISALLRRLNPDKTTPPEKDDTGQVAPDGNKWPTGAPKLILVTAHRRENFGQPLENICLALRDIAGDYQERILIVLPVHPNPNVDGLIRRMLGNLPNVMLMPPLDYVSMSHLLNKSYLVVTDSGGLQEEATSLGRPVLVIRKVTDRPESVEAGTARIVGVESETIVREMCRLLEDESAHELMAKSENVYGDGQASARIINAFLSFQE
jgi:UDP-N-acetylglucosamine 2-epimerase (non-hydrolysing)